MKEIGGIPLEKWKELFVKEAYNNIQTNHFSQIIHYDLFKGRNDLTYQDKWSYVYEAFEEVFDVKVERV